MDSNQKKSPSSDLRDLSYGRLTPKMESILIKKGASPQAIFSIKKIIEDLSHSGVSFYVDLKSSTVKTGEIECSGFFNPILKKIEVAIGKKAYFDWFSTLIHEYCHFLQWRENCDAWKNSMSGSGEDSDTILDKWLKGENYHNIRTVLNNIAFLEYDCEKRTVEFLNDQGFSREFDLALYARKATAYVTFYRHLLTKRKWYLSHKAPYLNPAIVDHMEGEFLPFDEYINSPRYDHLFWDSCFKDFPLEYFDRYEYVKTKLRAAFLKSPLYRETLKSRTIKVHVGYHNNGNEKYLNHYQCDHCKRLFPANAKKKLVSVDHIDPVIRLDKETPISELPERMFCREDNLQVLCSYPLHMMESGVYEGESCHYKKSALESETRSKNGLNKKEKKHIKPPKKEKKAKKEKKQKKSE